MSGFISDSGAAYLMALFANSEQPANDYWVALTHTIPAPYQNAADLSEPVEITEYARAHITNDGNAWTRSVETLSNLVEVAWPVASVAWGDFLGWAILDTEAVGTGRVLYGGDLGTTITVTSGVQPVMAVGQLSISLSISDWALET
jgi:hypothetical protein